MEITSIDDVLLQLGRFGRFQMMVYVLISLTCIPSSWHLLSIIFIGADPGHHCTIPQNATLNDTIPRIETNGVESWDSCRKYSDNGYMNVTVPCSQWSYGDGQLSTVLTEWNLVCERNYLVELSTCIFMVGTGCGAVLITPLSDRYGRRRILLACLWIQIALGVGIAFVNDYVLFVVLRFLLGSLNMAIGLVAYLLVAEVFPASSRTLPFIAIYFFWATGIMSLSLLAYLIPNWHYLQLAISLPNILTISYYWLLPESIPWLIAKRHLKRAREVIGRAERMNHVTLPDDVLDFVQLNDDDEARRMKCDADTDVMMKRDQPSTVLLSEDMIHGNQSSRMTNTTMSQREPVKYSPLDLFRTRRIRIYTLTMFYLWLVCSLAYFSTMFLLPSLHGNAYLNVFLGGVVEVPAYLICMYSLQWFGRRRPLCVFLLVCGLGNSSAAFCPNEPDLLWLKTCLALVGKFGITGAYATIYLFCSEIFPTVIRNQALGLCSFFENLGGITSPFIAYSAKFIPQLPMSIIGVMTVVAGVLSLFMPETHNRPLPETIEEVEAFKRHLHDSNEKAEQENNGAVINGIIRTTPF